jgi:hypothetical protein
MLGSMKKSAFVIVLGASAALAGTPPATFPVRAVDFDQSAMSSVQKKLLHGYLSKTKTTYKSWTENSDSYDNDGMIAAFLGVTRALSFLQIHLSDGSWITADKMLAEVNQFVGDRVKVRLNVDIFNSWRAAGAEFILTRKSGEVEHDNFVFDHGDFGGSLHDGSDIQGYTSYFLAPRIQINYITAINEADIDLDGYAPWIDGVIPNPFHMTWQNSDIRYWFDEYQASFGNPGFQVIAQ